MPKTVNATTTSSDVWIISLEPKLPNNWSNELYTLQFYNHCSKQWSSQANLTTYSLIIYPFILLFYKKPNM